MTDRPPQGPNSTSGPPPTAAASTLRGPDAVRCVLWHAPGAVMPGDLLSTLSKRISKFSFCTDAYAALANVCMIERDRRAAMARGEPGSASLIVLIEPQTLPDADQIVGAIGRYAPGATLRQYRSNANPRFAPIVEALAVNRSGDPARVSPSARALPQPQTMPAVVIKPQPPSPTQPSPVLRLAFNDTTPAHHARPPSLHMSEEELRILLSDEPDLGGTPSGTTPGTAAGGRP